MSDNIPLFVQFAARVDDLKLSVRVANAMNSAEGQFILYLVNNPAAQVVKNATRATKYSAEYNFTKAELDGLPDQMVHLILYLRGIQYGDDNVDVLIKAEQGGTALLAYDKNGLRVDLNASHEANVGELQTPQSGVASISIDVS